MGARWVTYPLTSNKTTACPTRIVYFDTETNYDESKQDQVHSFRLSVTAFQRYKRGIPQGNTVWRVHYTPESVWKYVSSLSYNGSCLWVIAHNLDFDFTAIQGFSQLVREHWQVKFWAISSNNFLLRIQSKRRSIQFLDSMGFIGASIKALGETLGTPKLPMPPQSASDSLWEEYCTRDVQVMKLGVEAFIHYIKDNDLGRFSFTIAGQALQAYRHRFHNDLIWIHRYPDVMQAERASYHGGRTEAFFIGKVPRSKIYYLDVNSMYPSVMLDHNYPIRYLSTIDKPTFKGTERIARDFEVLVEGRWNIREPVLPYPEKRLCFPIGRFSSIITGPEYRYLQARGWIEKIYTVWVYQRAQPWNEYISYFWKLRQEAITKEDKVYNWITKLFMNSLYGKFAQRNPTYLVEDATPGQPEGLFPVISTLSSHIESRMVLGGKVWLKTGEQEAQWTFYPLSSWVTAYARLKLWGLIARAGKGHVFYCDTDSVFVDQVGYDRLEDLIIPGKLGALGIKREGKTLTIKGAKDYEFDGVRYLKGVPLKAVEVSPGVFSYWTFLKTRTKMRGGDPNKIIQQTVTKKLNRQYDKGDILDSGEVIPYEFG